VIEPSFSEQDLLWKPLLGELPTDQDIRSKTVLDDVFSSDDSTWVSVTTHSGEIASILRGKSLLGLIKKDCCGEEVMLTSE
jgi:hypothetical protein